MNLTAFFIRRPAFTIVVSLMMVMVGLIAFFRLPVSWVPNVNPPIVSIMTMYSGANAGLVEHDVTKVIEDALSDLDGVVTIESSSWQGQSNITVTFELGRNMDTSVAAIRSNIERVRDALPKEADAPLVMKDDPNNQPMFYFTYTSDRLNDRELSDYITHYIVPLFETSPGVGRVFVYGKRTSVLRMSLDAKKMAGAHVAVDDVTRLLQSENFSLPVGQIQSRDRNYSVFTNTRLMTPDAFNKLMIRDEAGSVVRLSDIGHADIEAENADTVFRVNGKPALALAITPQATANPLAVETSVKKTFESLKARLPVGMQASIPYDQADYIRASIKSVYDSFFEAVVFVWLVILLFLASFRATLIPIITIPVCLICTFAIVWLFGFTINTVTLMAFVLGIGLVVDDAIVMLENINRYIENGASAMEAALKGSREIVVPIIAMTLTLAAVYAPIAFTPGLLGVIFKEFTFTLAGAVMISGVVALTLTPMMCAYLLKKETHTNRYKTWLAHFFPAMQAKYQRMLLVMLRKKYWVMLALSLLTIVLALLYQNIQKELVPQEDMSEIDIYAQGPRNASFQYVDPYLKKMEAFYNLNPDFKSFFTITGFGSPSHAFHVIMLKPKSMRKKSTADIASFLTEELNKVTGLRVNVILPPPPLAQFTGGDDGGNVGLVVETTKDYLVLHDAVTQLLNKFKNNPLFSHTTNRMKWDDEQFQVTINRERAMDLHVETSTIVDALSTFLAGKKIGKMNDIDVIVQMKKVDLTDVKNLDDIFIRNNNGLLLPLSQFISIQTVSQPSSFTRYERLRADTIYFTLAPNVKLSDAISTLTDVAKNTLPPDMKFTFTGEAKKFLESSNETLITFLLALLFIYLVLVAQFESFIDPFVILLTVPFAMIGALLALKMFGGTLNIYSNIGLITLIGLIAKHGILITDFANRERQNGASLQTAVVAAATLRLRPILMTTCAMILGALPLALSMGQGAESREQVGLVIVGGLLLGTFFSLIVVPVAYVCLARNKEST